MDVVVVTPPAPIVSTDEAKAQLRVDFDDDNALIDALIDAATSHLDGWAGVLQRALGAQTLKVTLDGFPAEPLRLPCPPIIAITAITYIDADGAEQTVDAATYELSAGGVLRLAYGQDWPTPRSDDDPVTITYTAGYDTVPGPIRQAILLMVGDLYANRETVVVGTVSAEIGMAPTVATLIGPYRVWRV